MSNTMNMRTFGLKMIAGVAIAGTVTMAMGTSAQAAGLTGEINFSWSADANPTNIDFKPFLGSGSGTVDLGAGDFIVSRATDSFSAIAEGTIGRIKDLTNFSNPVTDFISFQNPSLATYKFDLLSFVASPTAGRYTFTGKFGDGTDGEGELTTQILGTGIKAYSGTLVAVPTPALLPGLIGIGMAAMRKRQSKTATA
jgi:hypothetical protein